MTDKLQVVWIIVTISTAAIFSGLFSSELFTIYNVDISKSDNSSIVTVTNIGVIQAENPSLFILTSKKVDNVTTDCIEGEPAHELENQNVTKIKFERISKGISCDITLKDIKTDEITNVIITSKNRSAYDHRTNNTWMILFIIVSILIIELVFTMIVFYAFIVDDIYKVLFYLIYKKSINHKKIQAKIKSEFGIKLSSLSIEILNIVNSNKTTLLQISVQLGIPEFLNRYNTEIFSQLRIPPYVIKRRLKRLEKLELILPDRKLHPKIKEIIESN